MESCLSRIGRRPSVPASIICCLLASLVAASGAQASNIILNPSFEAGLTDWSLTSGDGGAQYGLVPNFAFTGNQSIIMANCNPTFPINLKQDLGTPLVAGQAYELSFWVYNLGLGNDELGVLLYEVLPNDNALVQALLPSDIVPTELEGWGQVVIPFVATVDGNQLNVFGYDNGSSIHLDEFNLMAVPEPTTLGLLALAGVAAIRRRHR